MKNYHITLESNITILDKDFWDEQEDKKIRRAIARPKAFTGKFGYKFFKNSKGYKTNIDDIIALMDSMIGKNNKHIINLKK